MSINCIHCVTNERTGSDLLCDDCRTKLKLELLDRFIKAPGNLDVAGIVNENHRLRASHDRLLEACEELIRLSESGIFKGSDAHPSLEDSDAVASARASIAQAKTTAANHGG